MHHDKRGDDGFTLVELLVVVIIIGILAAIAIPVFMVQRERSQVSQLTSDLRNAAILMETDVIANDGVYDFAWLNAPGAWPGTATVLRQAGPNVGAQGFCIEVAHVNRPLVTYIYDNDAGGIAGPGATCP